MNEKNSKKFQNICYFGISHSGFPRSQEKRATQFQKKTILFFLPSHRCQESFGTFKQLSEHKNKHTSYKAGSDKIKCHLCERFVGKVSLRSHIKRMHEKSPGQCDHCGKEFENELKLKTHVNNVHLKDKVDEFEMCQICNTMVKKYGMKSHIKRQHDETTPCQCDNCGKHFKNEIQLKSHVHTYHKEDSKEACVICGKIIFKCYMKNHIKSVHDKVKDFQCSTCGKAFSFKATLKKHSLIHTGVREHECSKCSKLFTCHRNMMEHMKSVHLGIKDAVCTYCGKAFTKGKLKRHIDTVHLSIKKFKCHICTQKYGQSHELKKHLVSFHKKIVPKNQNIFELQEAGMI